MCTLSPIAPSRLSPSSPFKNVSGAGASSIDDGLVSHERLMTSLRNFQSNAAKTSQCQGGFNSGEFLVNGAYPLTISSAGYNVAADQVGR